MIYFLKCLNHKGRVSKATTWRGLTELITSKRLRVDCVNTTHTYICQYLRSRNACDKFISNI